ncbi:MAG: ATP-binding cassette domain-containing protein, partial [Bacteroidota bacterium]
EPRLVRMMIGRDLDDDLERPSLRQGRRLLEVKDLRAAGIAGPCTFHVDQGEIVGLFGLVGAGRTELFKGLFGALPRTDGEVKLDGRSVRISSPSAAIELGIGLVPESRKEEGLVLGLSVEKNMTICLWQTMQRMGFLLGRLLRQTSSDYVKRLDVKTPGLRQEVRNLSGGNQQKVVLAKWLAKQCRVLVLDEPTRGIDVGAKREIYHLIRELAGQGLGIIMISSELSEVMSLSHRILVMRKGRIVAEYPANAADKETILSKAMGVKTNGNHA